MIFRLLVMVLAVAVPALMVGCSKSLVEPQKNGQDLNLEDEFGGYSACTESPGFGDPDLLATQAAASEFADP
ncbi:MAG: hypothetical protein AB1744_06000, partial [Candidatus Zixiibacteriota bacterium]